MKFKIQVFDSKGRFIDEKIESVESVTPQGLKIVEDAQNRTFKELGYPYTCKVVPMEG